MVRLTPLLIPLISLSLASPVGYAGLYRWVDDEGNVHYTDTIPPSQVTKGHTEITEQGIRVKTVPPAKTAEELQKEQELERLRAQQERLIEQQRAADRVLIQTFRSDDDIVMARDGKMASIDVMIQVTKNNIRRQQEWLGRLRTEAANLERAGKPVPQHLSDSIANAERSIRDAYATILDREAQKRSIRESFDRDLKRFRELNKLSDSQKPREPQTRLPVLHNIVNCRDTEECERLWSRAVAYVQQHATTQVQTSGANILIAAPAASGDDISLILSRINDKDGEGSSLFLDLQCQSSLRGEEMCQSPEAKEILAGFRAALTGGEGPD
jgi:hypothetical protein